MKQVVLSGAALAVGLAWSPTVGALSLHPLAEQDWVVIERAEILGGLHGYPHLDKAVGWREGQALLALPDLDPFVRGQLQRLAPTWQPGLHGQLSLGGVWSKGQGVATVNPPSADHSPLSDQRWGMWDPEKGSVQGGGRIAIDGESWALRGGAVGQTGGGRQVGVVTDLEGRVALGNQVVAVGRGKGFWGYGSHGSLILGNNATPLDRVALGNDAPYDLPVLGPFRYEVAVSRLEPDRVVPSPLWLGIHFEFQPTDRFEIGFYRVIMMGGEGRPSPWTPSRLLRILSGINIGQNSSLGGDPGTDTSNSIAGMTMSYTTGGVKFYLDMGGEDEARGLPSVPSIQVGFFRPGLAPDGRGDLRVEYARTDVQGSHMWYRHHIYTDGYTYRGGLMGHHIGTNGADILLSYRIWDEEGGWSELAFDQEKRAINNEGRASERRTQFTLSGLYPLAEGLGLDWMGGVERIENRGGGWKTNTAGNIIDAKGPERSGRGSLALNWQF